VVDAGVVAAATGAAFANRFGAADAALLFAVVDGTADAILFISIVGFAKGILSVPAVDGVDCAPLRQALGALEPQPIMRLLHRIED
jgi:hypothetical protein